MTDNEVKNIAPKKRVHYFDIAKGILILLLLVHHYGSATSRAHIDSTFQRYVTIWQPLFTTFFMQCFFIISGYCSNFKKKPQVFYNSLFRQLIIPFVVFQIFGYMNAMVISDDYSINCLFKAIQTPPYTSLWFLIALLSSKFIVYNLKLLKISDIAVLITTFVLLIIGIILAQFHLGTNILCYQNSLVSSFFVAVGYYLKNNEYIYNRALKLSSYMFPITIIPLMIFHLPTPTFNANIGVSMKTIPLFITLSFTGSFAFLNLCKKINSNKILEYFGRNSLTIYCLHFISLFILIKSFWTLFNPTSIWLFSLFFSIVYCLELVCCVMWIQLFNSKYLKWVIGK